MNNYENVNSLELIINEIEKSIECGNNFAALMMSLTIPDILGEIAYKDYDNSTNRYIKWFDENVKNVMGLLYSDNYYKERKSPKFNGHACHKLRSTLFHDGTANLKEQSQIDEFVLSLSNADFITGDYAGNEYEYEKYNRETGEVPKTRYLYISCKELSRDIVNAAKDFIEHNPALDYPTIKVNNGGGHINKSLILDRNKKE